MKSRKSLFIHQMAGRFPGSQNIEEFWTFLKNKRVADNTHLGQYWGISADDLSDSNKDGAISMPYGKICDVPVQKRSILPRQIQLAVDVINEVTEDSIGKKLGLVVATEWTDPSYYQAYLGKIPKSKSYSVEKQIETIKKICKISGPALAVDTACASSLYGLEIARSMLESGEVDAVVVLGLNMYLHSFLYRGFTKLGAFSQSAKLRSFDINADGIVPGESVCAALISFDFENAAAKIEGIGLSCDGKEGSPFSPGLEGQLNAYRRAYSDADLSPEKVSYIEAHGTGTVLGDKTEAQSILNFFKREKTPLYIASSKSNIGHTLAASGMVALIKSALMLQKKEFLPHIDVADAHFGHQPLIQLIKEPIIFGEETHYVGISSFGFGGSNAHVILSNHLTANEDTMISPKKIKVLDWEYLNQDEIDSPPEILKGVALGPRMQERIDPLQRKMMGAVQKLIQRQDITEEQQEKLSCIFLNNLGGSLSLKYENKYQKAHDSDSSYPELTIEGIASTLPSMISGYPSALFNFKGHHCLLSGYKGSLEEVLVFLPSLLETLEGDLILGIGHYSDIELEKKHNSPFILLYLTKRSVQARVEIELDKTKPKIPKKLEDYSVATGVKELLAALENDKKNEKVFFSKHGFNLVKNQQLPNLKKIADELLRESEENTKIALEYLSILKSLAPFDEEIYQESVGEFLIDAKKTQSFASAQLVIDEGHPYFFDHPLDHVPGILMIHACEELLYWFKGESWTAVGMSIRFTKFLEKNQDVFLSCKQVNEHKVEFNIEQGKRSVGIISFDIMNESYQTIQGRVDEEALSIDDKKITHKYRKDNVLVSKLGEINPLSSQARDFAKAGHHFFSSLLKRRHSLLYYSEVGRQFIMSMAHLEKKIGLEKKMNLISLDLEIMKRIIPPFEMNLRNFELTNAQNFTFADVEIELMNDKECFGKVILKAQVVDEEYYKKQRGQG